jgi:hypothetical protein
MRNTCAVTYNTLFLPTKPVCGGKPSYILRGLQIPILGTSGLQIRWDGVFAGPVVATGAFVLGVVNAYGGFDEGYDYLNNMKTNNR